jgi:hypothetical protein
MEFRYIRQSDRNKQIKRTFFCDNFRHDFGLYIKRYDDDNNKEKKIASEEHSFYSQSTALLAD